MKPFYTVGSPISKTPFKKPFFATTAADRSTATPKNGNPRSQKEAIAGELCGEAVRGRDALSGGKLFSRLRPSKTSYNSPGPKADRRRGMSS
ncbi:hypothetical protein ACMD2_15719 [Ananas comosus]|uniref:Uncharacterized protein n=1 Tax=Ananas comosus TaxID=4615 RepID=A0A199VAZ6_ANACO|nr:hypothetical protein ACMD2_15719 [Ananas comosus]